MKPSPVIETRDGRPSILRKAVVVEKLNYYRRSDILHQLTIAFCRRFLPACGDRTVDQMVQAARSTKQNIVEGHSDGQTSVETEVRLLGIARGSCRELLQDYQDYMAAHGLSEWKGTNPRFAPLHRFCRDKTDLSDYQPHFARWTDDEMANCALCLAHMVDKALTTVIEKKDKEFVEQGGIKERMTAARLGYRTDQKERIAALEAENAALRAEIARLRDELKVWKTGSSGSADACFGSAADAACSGSSGLGGPAAGQGQAARGGRSGISGRRS
jgi:four helix bundle suffix protein